MKRLDNLPQIAARQLGGLTASETLFLKAKLQAAEAQAPKSRMRQLRPVMALCMALVLCVGAVWALRPADSSSPIQAANVLDSHSAGTDSAGTDSAPTAQPRLAADVPSGAISMSAGMRRSADTLFADLGSAAFPLITLDGATYRLLLSPASVSEELLGHTLGTVSEFNIEPALGSGGVVSNAVLRGESIRAVDGMDSALVAAPVDGTLRLFQRVSYAGTAIIGDETLEDTLCAPQDALWIDLSGLGRIEDPATVQALLQTLIDYADYQSTSLSGEGSMQIGLKNGLVLQLLTGEDTVSACGTWSCPDFFEAYEAALP